MLLIELVELTSMRYGLLYDRIIRQNWSVDCAVKTAIPKRRSLL